MEENQQGSVPMDRNRILEILGPAEHILTPKGYEIAFYFSSHDLSETGEEYKEVKQTAAELYIGAYDYLYSILGEEFPFFSNNIRKFVTKRKIWSPGDG